MNVIAKHLAKNQRRRIMSQLPWRWVNRYNICNHSSRKDYHCWLF